jgi:hypothetical protein
MLRSNDVNEIGELLDEDGAAALRNLAVLFLSFAITAQIAVVNPAAERSRHVKA